ncbi:protein hobbit [Microplitis demolitor]|uniref:protein hobbit n=1 Tax=Microplitis demolitor TaxID=69319 RepID=UPI0004CDDB6D|nr:protein hobbit [Microplitis demolitor]XP_053595589.1 protein hobbit [Microplitis demolitor]XP_053595590.1 protein hobbit [Microplitis demolitor]
MTPLVVVCFIFIIIYSSFTWILPRGLAWLVKRKYKIHLRVGHIIFPYLVLRDVTITKNGFTVQIEEITIRSSLLSSDVAKLFAVVMHDVRINKDVPVAPSVKNENSDLTLDFRNKTVPPIIIKFVQFMAVHVENVNLLALGNGWLVNGSAESLSLDGSVVHGARTLLASATITGGSVKLLHHASDACLSQISFAGSVEATLKAQGELTVEKLYIGVMQTESSGGAGLMQFLRDRQSLSPQPLPHYIPTNEYYQNLLARFAPILPKNLTLKVGSSSVIIGRDDGSFHELEGIMKHFQLNAKFQPNGPQIHLALNLEGFSIKAKMPILSLRSLSIECKLREDLLRVETLLHNLYITYDYQDWESILANQNQVISNSKVSVSAKNKFPWLQIQTTAELHEGLLVVRLPVVPEASCSVSHVNVSINRYATNDEDWKIKLMMESLKCALNGNTTHTLDTCHHWGSPLSVGVLVATIHPNAIGIALDALRTEWSLEFARFLKEGITYWQEYHGLLIGSKQIEESTRKNIHQLNLKISNCNFFFIAENELSVMVRLDSANIEQSNKRFVGVAEGLCAITLNKNEPIVYEHSQVLKHPFLSIRKFKGALTSNSVSVSFDNTSITWSPNLHLRLLQLWIESSQFRKILNSSDSIKQFKPKRSLDLLITGGITLAIDISQTHFVELSSDQFRCTQNKWQLNYLRGSLNMVDIITIEGVELVKLEDSEEVRLERQNNEGFELDWNETWSLTIESAKARFPYEHCFTEAIQNELMSIRKWLKEIHSSDLSKKKSLPCDLVIKIKEWVFEVSDDPFEVRLRDNYELLEDEYNESLKRQAMLDAKVQELCRAHLLLPQGKVEELYASLNKKNAEIYVQRWRQMQRAGPSRTRLFAWTMQDLEIIALADPTIDGIEKATRAIVELDSESPWPEEGIEFNILWVRGISLKCVEWKLQLRDFPQPLLLVEGLSIWGRLGGAEALAPSRARRTIRISIGEPWDDIVVERGMTSLKYYHDLNWDIDKFRYAFGPCWEPVIAQCNLSFEKILHPSRDPSPPLPFWDKIRLILHGRITLCVKQLTVLLHASLDPYNTTEEMELTWSGLELDWTLGKIIVKGDLDVYVRTASKYDDCRLLHLPNVKLGIKLAWVCLGDSRDHYAAIPCAPDRLPEYSSNQEHDSFRAFRSQNLNVSLALETKLPGSPTSTSAPTAVLYGSTLRWFENLKFILSGATRPTRKGRLFKNIRPRKKQLSRHYRKVRLTLAFHRFHVSYWMSFAMQRGFEVTGGRVACSSEHNLTLYPINDGLIHRLRAEWSVIYMNCELNDAEIWLKSALQAEEGLTSLRQPVEKCYCLSVSRVSYGREALVAEISGDTPTHRLVVHDLKGAWTKTNRDVAFALFDSFIKTQQLKKNLSTAALKGFHRESNALLQKNPTRTTENQNTPTQVTSSATTSTTATKSHQPEAAGMLQRLVAEATNKPIAFSDDLSSQTRGQQLRGLAACNQDDVLHKNWLIALVNSQVLLKGIETRGYVILSAAKAEILQRVHRPVWRERTLVSKTTWVGSLECMQYYATVSANIDDNIDDNIMWLTVDNIQEKDSTVISGFPDVPALVGSGQSVGGVVSQTVGGGGGLQHQLQRIVSRCKCEFFYVGYSQALDSAELKVVPPPPREEITPWERKEFSAADAFTLMHYDLDVCTNSLQYAMILDVVNNLLLYVEPRRKEAMERLQIMRFQLQLHSVEDQKRPIQQLQNTVRGLVAKLRRLEKETYLVQKALAEESNTSLLSEMERLEVRVFECKEQLGAKAEELDVMLSCYKETTAPTVVSTTLKDKPAAVARSAEICFKHAQWRLTDADGQLGIADLVLTNFLYTKTSKTDDSVEHLLELGYVRMTNLLPNQIYTEVLTPTELQSNMPVERQRTLRVFCREKAPVAGISVKEHFEINVAPLTIGLTKKFFNTMLKFCFPERDPDAIEEPQAPQRDSSFYVPMERRDDVEKMKERADKNKLFIYIKIPEVPVRVSYKGNKEKNLEDVRDFGLVIPTLEYHNVTWTWLDLLLAMKNDSRRVILSQAIKQKLQIKPKGPQEETMPQEEDKARLLLGARHLPGDAKKKSVFKFK